MVSSEELLGQLIGRNIKKSNDLNRTMSHPSGEDTNIVFPTNVIKPLERACRLKSRLIGTAFVIGHPNNGIIGTSIIGAGTMSDWSDLRVLCPNNLFEEWFGSSSFVDTLNTDCSVDYSDEEANFGVGQVFRTKIIHSNNEVIKNVRIVMNVRSGSNIFVLDTTTDVKELNVVCD